MNNPLNERADEIIAEALWHIDAEADLHGWDQDAALYAVMIHPFKDPVQIEEMGDKVAAGLIELMPMPAWEMVFENAPNTRSALKMMAHMLSMAPPELKELTFPSDFYGLAFVTEAYVLKAPRLEDGEPDPEIVARIEAEMQAGSIAEHPDRIEIRFIYCVSKDGTAAALSHERDGIAEALTDGNMIGAIPDRLAEIIKEITS